MTTYVELKHSATSLSDMIHCVSEESAWYAPKTKLKGK